MSGKSIVEKMKAKVRAKIRKKQGGSIKERLAAAKAKNPARKEGKGSEKVEAKKARIRDIIKRKY